MRKIAAGLVLSASGLWVPKSQASVPLLKHATINPTAPAGGCTTIQNSFTSGSSDWEAFYSSTTYHYATHFTVGGTGYTVCKVEVSLKRKGTISATVNAEIWTHNSGQNDPQGQHGSDSDDTLSASSVGTSAFEWVAWNWASGPTLTASTVYWLVLDSDTIGDLSNCLVVNKAADSGNKIAGGSTTPTWSDESDGDSFDIRIYGS